MATRRRCNIITPGSGSLYGSGSDSSDITISDEKKLGAGAYVTFLAGAGDYVKGVVALANSLRRASSSYPLVVALLADVPLEHRQLLLRHGCLLRPIDPITPRGGTTHYSGFAMPQYAVNYSKLAIWTFEEFEKMVYLDADMVVYENIDELFDLPKGRFYAVMDCFCEWSHSLMFKVKYCQQCPEKNPWPEHLGKPPRKYFNAGMFVYEPSQETFDRMMSTLRSSPPTPFAEQDFLNNYFWDAFTPISSIYNLGIAQLWLHPDRVELEKVKVGHYSAKGSKPWDFTGAEENMDREEIRMLVERWWDIYNDDQDDAVADAYPSSLPSIRGRSSSICNFNEDLDSSSLQSNMARTFEVQ